MDRFKQATARRDKVLAALHKAQAKTARELGEPGPYLWELERAGYLRSAGKQRNGGPGRPAKLHALTDKGRKRAAKRAKAAA